MLWVAGSVSPLAASDRLWLQSEEVHASLGFGGLALVLLILVSRLLRRRTEPASQPSLQAATRRPKTIGIVAASGLLVFVGGWSALAPLASAAIAPGVLSPAGNRKTVEHLEGGIIKTIHVQEGDQVIAGAPLVTLEDVQAKAQYAQLRKRFLHLTAVEARLMAERSGKAKLAFPETLTRAAEPDAVNAMNAQLELFDSRRISRESREQVLRKRVSQLNEQNAGLEQVLAAQETQIHLLEEEIQSAEKLLESGLEKRPRVLALQRERADVEAQKASNRARIAENGQKIGETEIQLLTLREHLVEEANDQLVEVQRVLSEIRTQLPSREDVLVRTVIRAPLAGTIMNIQPTTETGVIRSGEPILEIVPDQPNLVVEAKVRPSDIDRVYSGMEARVVLTAYRQRNLPLIHGQLQSISADRLVESRTGKPYFLAKISVNREDLEGLESVHLVPGMPAEVMLLDGELSFLEYLISPLSHSIEKSFREN